MYSSQSQIDSKKDIVAQIRARDALHRRRGFAEFSYTSKKLGFNSTKRVMLNFDQLEMSFFDKDGIAYSDRIECALSIYQTETPGRVFRNIAMIDPSNSLLILRLFGDKLPFRKLTR
jgi:hypothetical protein